MESKQMAESACGIGRVPADVDLTAEALAEAEAQRIEAAQARRQAAAYTPRCCEPDCGQPVPAQIWQSGTMGCCVMCERHWLDYTAQMFGLPRAGLTVAQALARYAEQERHEEARIKRCARCGSQAARWNSGAGEDLCSRHWDNY